MQFKAEPNGKTTLLFQDNGWGEDSLYNVIHHMKLPNIEGDITVNRDSGWVTISHPKSLKTIDFEYTIKRDVEGKLTSRSTYRPIINEDYFHVFSHNLLMLPRDYANTSYDLFNVNISWKGFPENYVIHNSFGSGVQEQFIEETNERKFHSAVFMGGDFRIHHININENDVAFATRGDWQAFDDETIIKALKTTIKTQRDLMQDHSQDYFSVSIIPTVQERGSSFQGTGLTNSFAMSASNNEYLEFQGLVYLLNHEHQHNWIGHLIKNDNEEEQYWFSEGFTDYYTIKNIAKNKINNSNADYFIEELNGFIKALYNSPVKEAPNSEINYDNFWTNRDYEKLPYRRGAVFAFYLDQKIQQQTKGEKSLDNVILRIKQDALTKTQRLSHPYFIELMTEYLGADFKTIFEKHIVEGKLIDLQAMFSEFGYEYDKTTDVFDLGFEYSDDRRSIASIDKNSEAYKAGLRIKDKFKRISVYNGYIEYKAEFTVVRDGKEIDISYYPVKHANIAQLKINDHNKKILNL